MLTEHPDAVQNAYMAGFYDGEGTVTFNNRGVPVGQLSGTRDEPLRIFQARYGGNMHLYDHNASVNGRPHWKWQATGRIMLLQMCNDLLPFATVKRSHWELMLEFITGGVPKTHQEKVTPEEETRRNSIIAQIRELNKRGRQPDVTD